jgi:hypothetical protein
MKKFKCFLTFAATTLAFNIVANPLEQSVWEEFSGERSNYDAKAIDLLNAVNECSQAFKQALDGNGTVSAASVEYPSPENQDYSISTNRGKSRGPALSIARHFQDGRWTAKCLILE